MKILRIYSIAFVILFILINVALNIGALAKGLNIYKIIGSFIGVVLLIPILVYLFKSKPK